MEIRRSTGEPAWGYLTDPHGHFDFSEEKQKYFSYYIKKKKQNYAFDFRLRWELEVTI